MKRFNVSKYGFFLLFSYLIILIKNSFPLPPQNTHRKICVANSKHTTLSKIMENGIVENKMTEEIKYKSLS